MTAKLRALATEFGGETGIEKIGNNKKRKEQTRKVVGERKKLKLLFAKNLRTVKLVKLRNYR